MSRFRICPHGVSGWKVQKLLCKCFWSDCGRVDFWGDFELKTYKHRHLASASIDESLKEEFDLLETRRLSKVRKLKIKPEEYP